MAVAQSHVGNTGPLRPAAVEDATPMPRQVLEVYVTAVVERGDGLSSWSAIPGLAYGLASRTQVDVRLPIAYPAEGGGERGIAGGDLSILYALNVETRTLPAFAARGGVLTPVGAASATNGHEWLRGIVSKRMFGGRAHFNYQYTFGDEPSAVAVPTDLSRWLTGISYDRLFPVSGLLLSAEGAARQPIVDAVDPYWTVAAAARYQLTRQAIIEASISRVLDGPDTWSVSLGLSWSRAMGSLLPGLGRWGR